MASLHYDPLANRMPYPLREKFTEFPKVSFECVNVPTSRLQFRAAGSSSAEDIQSRNRVLLRATAARKVPQTPWRYLGGLMKAIVRPIRGAAARALVEFQPRRPPFRAKLAARLPLLATFSTSNYAHLHF